MSNGFHNATIQAQATRDAAHSSTRAQLLYAEKMRNEKAEKLAKCIEDFANLDESSLFCKSDKELAMFQAGNPPESPQYALALHEWNRRLVTRQVRATRFAAIIGVIGIIIGVILGWLLASYTPPWR